MITVPPRGPSWPERLLGGAVLLLIAALALRWAVDVVVSIIWPLVGIVVVGLLMLIVWRLWQSRRGGW